MQYPAPAAIDWQSLILDLRRSGLTLTQVAKRSGIPCATIAGWQNYHVEPRHRAGEQMISLWCRITQRDRAEVPLQKSLSR